MSFLRGRLAGAEGAYFYQETKHAVARLVQNNRNLPVSASKAASSAEHEGQADVLPEVLRHSLPSKIFHQQPLDSSLSSASKWVLHSDPKATSTPSSNDMNPLRAYLSLPQVTFGPKRWQLPEQGNSVLASTANELRRDRYSHVNPEKLKAAAEGLSQIGKAFAVATVVVFGGATLMFGVAVSKLQVHNSDDIRIKGRELVQPKFDMLREQLIPMRIWVENVSKKWHVEREEDIKEKPIIKELTKILGAKTSN
ncbi:uncharacterized protein LOC100263749 [Vitis vinifera]|uniref:Uncharacterized protein n=1 Tax=Vitis vinifera TaxID=29760 RepID=D7TEC2_VITVI|eukprot:XP_002273465.1 PREDICTED: uncharacterized protein LOC100263749 [Vitis vinifera]